MSSSHKPYFPQNLCFLLSSKVEVFCPLSLILIFLTTGSSLFIPSEIYQVCIFLLIFGMKHLVCLSSLNPCVQMNKLPVFQVPLWSFCCKVFGYIFYIAGRGVMWSRCSTFPEYLFVVGRGVHVHPAPQFNSFCHLVNLRAIQGSISPRDIY